MTLLRIYFLTMHYWVCVQNIYQPLYLEIIINSNPLPNYCEITTACQVTEYENQMYSGGSVAASVATKVDCALHCQQNANCQVASFNAASLQCLVLNSAATRTAVSGVYAFERACKSKCKK